ncbi:hypothetical protein A2U01_0106028, partial [Trifolium medium]|nr:hypothetical protein [Trifolium medium]
MSSGRDLMKSSGCQEGATVVEWWSRQR